MANIVDFVLNLKNNVSPGLATIAGRIRQFVTGTEQAQGAVNTLGSGIGKLAGLAATAFAGAQILEFGKKIISAGADMEQTRVRFEVFTGSAEAANEQIAKLAELATRTPFAKTELLQYGLQLRGTGLDADATAAKLETLANISSATGKDLGELTSLWTKNKGSGIIQGEDLNQLSDANIPLDGFAKQLGVNVQQLRKLGSEGKVTFHDLDKYLESLGGKTGKWGDLNAKMSNTLIGKWSNLQDTVEQMISDFGESKVPFLTSLLDKFNVILDWVTTNKQKFADLFEPLRHSLEPVMRDFEQLRQQFGLTGDTTSILSKGVEMVQQVIDRLEPAISAVTSKIGPLIQIALRLYNTFDKLWTRFAGESFGSSLLRGLNLLIEGFERILDSVVGVFDGVATLVDGIAEGDWSKMGKGLKDAIVNGYKPILFDDPKYRDIRESGIDGNLTSGERRRQLDALPLLPLLPLQAQSPFAPQLTGGLGSLNPFQSSALMQANQQAAERSKAVAGKLGAPGAGKDDTKLTSKLGDVAGTKPTTVNITIQKLTGVENQTVHTTKEAVGNMKQAIIQTTLEAINDVSMLADR